ncbi:gliding motility-associated ABC transporter substrate-binding protein GldG [Pedobacter polaris]|uniref:Gliding motility-associated ABC transporter substrate-binding protein GldG n=1 Tax=Pedobacter polaris TaxID=2571273 RepID=A0A4U1CM09_9SPHI|nr:gliding motility-associated ABC transporter substrate-binding protein GldG [Pedobacter polaris]TKC08296.1 gliding motility-associated ABC transporter substrate-binding protein GldG [Pedobacter polaris]
MVGVQNKAERLKTKGQGLKKKNYLKILVFLIVLILINVLAQYFYTRFDFTKEKRYTLNQKSKEILTKTEKDITITVFLDGEIPAAFKRLRNATKDLLNDYKAYSSANVKIIFEDPLAGVIASEQDTIIKNLGEIGIRPVAVNIKNDAGLTQKIIFPMALIEIDGKPMAVNLLQKTGGPATDYETNITSSIQTLEYSFTSAIKRLEKGYSPKIGFTEGHGESSNPQFYDAINNTLSQNFYVGWVDLKIIKKQGLDDLDVIFIAKPKTALTELEKYKINYFVMKGGKLVWSIDQVTASLDSLQKKPQMMAFNNQLNIDDMLFEYGARINYNLITDVNCASIPIATNNPGQQAQIDLAPWIYYPILAPDTTNAIVKNIDGIRAEFASTVDIIDVPNVTKKVILQTSPYNKVFETPKMLSLQMLAQEPKQEEYTSTPKTAGILLEGNFKSVFLNRPIPEGITENYNVPSISKPTKMIVIGDGDIFTNQYSSTDNSVFPLGLDRYTQQNYGNKALLLNIADYFTDDNNLIALRNKEIKVRLLDKARLRTEKLKWQVINSIVPLVLLICFAIFQHYYRKHKYAK